VIAQRAPKQTSGDERRARAIVNERDEGRCVRCRRVGRGTHWDHRQNRSQLGRWEAANGQLLCGPSTGDPGCHEWKTKNGRAAALEGWAVPADEDPHTYPARRWAVGKYGVLHLIWVLYNNAGSWVEITDEEARERIEKGRAA